MVNLLDPAPLFRAPAVSGRGEVRELALLDLRGRWVVLFFYPGDFTPVCPTEIREFSQRAPEFRALGAEVVGCSVDGVESHRAWIADGAHQGQRYVAVFNLGAAEQSVTLRWDELGLPKS